MVPTGFPVSVEDCCWPLDVRVVRSWFSGQSCEGKKADKPLSQKCWASQPAATLLCCGGETVKNCFSIGYRTVGPADIARLATRTM